MLEDVKKKLDKTIDANDVLGVKIAWELILSATKKLNETCHRAKQARIRTDICMKYKCAFEKLMRTYKKK